MRALLDSSDVVDELDMPPSVVVPTAEADMMIVYWDRWTLAMRGIMRLADGVA